MGLSKLWGKDSSGAHGFVFSHIKAIYYNFSQNKLLSTKLDEMDAKDTATDNKIGNLSDLTTSVKSSVVAAITEVVSDMGDLSDLDSSVKTSLVAAINEALGNAQTAQNSVGTLSSLTTTAKTSAVAAINELNSKILGTFINQNQDIRINHYVWSGDLVAGKTATLGTFALPDGASQLVGMLLTPRGSVHISLMWDGRTVYAYSETFTGHFSYDALMFWV